MSDRELQEAAARAAGIRVKWEPVHGCLWIEPGQGLQIDPWTPLTDDAQALRLAVKLKITDLALAVGRYVMAETHREGDDIYAITRRAIVRAAAETSRESGRGDEHVDRYRSSRR